MVSVSRNLQSPGITGGETRKVEVDGDLIPLTGA